MSKDECAPLHIHVNNPSDGWCCCAWNPALRESAPGSGACDWPHLAMVAGAASTKVLWRRRSKGARVGGAKGGGATGGGGSGGGGGGLWAKWGQGGVKVEKVARGYGVGEGQVSRLKKRFRLLGEFFFRPPPGSRKCVPRVTPNFDRSACGAWWAMCGGPLLRYPRHWYIRHRAGMA